MNYSIYPGAQYRFGVLVLIFSNLLSKSCVPNHSNGHVRKKNGMDPTTPGVPSSISLQNVMLLLSDSVQRPHPVLRDVTF